MSSQADSQADAALLIEDFLDVQQAAELLDVAPISIRRYYTHGFRGVCLRTALIGHRRVTTRQWINRFIERTTAADRITAAVLAQEAEHEAEQAAAESAEASRQRFISEGIIEP